MVFVKLTGCMQRCNVLLSFRLNCIHKLSTCIEKSSNYDNLLITV